MDDVPSRLDRAQVVSEDLQKGESAKIMHRPDMS